MHDGVVARPSTHLLMALQPPSRLGSVQLGAGPLRACHASAAGLPAADVPGLQLEPRPAHAGASPCERSRSARCRCAWPTVGTAPRPRRRLRGVDPAAFFPRCFELGDPFSRGAFEAAFRAAAAAALLRRLLADNCFCATGGWPLRG